MSTTGGHQRQKEYRRHIVQRNGADEDQGQRAVLAIDILHQSGSQQRLAAAIAGLRKFRPQRFFPQQGQSQHHQDRKDRSRQAKQHHTAIPQLLEVGCDHILKKLDRQGDFKNKGVELVSKLLCDPSGPAEQMPQHHHQKYRHRGIETENEILRKTAPVTNEQAAFVAQIKKDVKIL